MSSQIPKLKMELLDSTAPHWQYPGVGWESLPLVPYASYKEYEGLVLDLCKGLHRVVGASVAKELELMGGDFLWSVSLNGGLNGLNGLNGLDGPIGLSVDLKREWMAAFQAIFLEFTKGEGGAWCDQVAAMLVAILNTFFSAFFKLQEFPASGFDEMWDKLLHALHVEVECFVRVDRMNPLGLYSFENANFVTSRGYYDYNGYNGIQDLYVMPVGKFQDVMAAFCMGRHARLGGGSAVCALDDDVARLIFTFGLF